MQAFGEATRAWFRQAFSQPTAIQARGWEAIARGEHTLLTAPTGSGKTLAAFLWGIDRTLRLDPEAPPGVRIVYVSPLKALVYDIERNLRAPLVGIERAAERLEIPIRRGRVDVRTGDTPSADRRAQLRRPGDLLVTTPESLFLLLGSRARATLASVHTVIVDEIHALAPTKRGAHLALSLERLRELTAAEPQRIGLSATVRPAEEVARFLAGDRPCTVVDASEPPRLDLEVVVPVADMERAAQTGTARPGGAILAEVPAPPGSGPGSGGSGERGIWPAIYPALLERILANRSTIVFVNSRGLCERLAQRLNELAGEELVRAHHGSISHEKRAEIEEGLKRGAIRGIVATSSLELGIDMGTVDLVVLMESPGSVARGLQRVGRSGHRIGAASTGRIFPKFRGDLLECALIASRMLDARIEALTIPASPLDVLAQQCVAMCCDAPRTPAALLAIATRAYPFRRLGAELLGAVLDMLSGAYPSDEFADLTPVLSWDRASDQLMGRRGTPLVTRLNAGTIPDRGQYGVFLGEDGPRVGELDEEMVFETRIGENVILGASTWRVERITRDRVLVSPAPGEPGRMPFWHGDGPGRPLELGRALGAFVAEIGSQRAAEVVSFLQARCPLDTLAASNLAAYVREQLAHTGSLPTDRSITVERFRDELGDWRVCILSLAGSPVHAPWAMALSRTLAERSGFEVQVMYTDDGIVLRFADVEEPPGVETLFPDPDEVQDLVTEELGETALFAALFRENAARALLLPRRSVRRRNPLWAQRRKAQALLASVRKYPGFAIVLETYRQALNDVFDMQGLRALLGEVRSGTVRVHEVETPSASPFARSLVFAYVAAYIYEQDAPLAERKAQALTLDRNLLRELLGETGLRELVDETALAQMERDLQLLGEERAARDADQLHDRLRRLGDLTEVELAARCARAPAPWLEHLEAQRRAFPVTLAGERRWIAAEDAGLYRDALGAAPPAGLPEAFGAVVEDPLERLLRRYARTHGPFLTAGPATRFGLRPAALQPALELLAARGTIVRGEIRPEGTTPEWCDAEVLKQLKRRTLAVLRNQVTAVDAHRLGVFLPGWHGLGAGVRPGPAGSTRLATALAQLEGAALPWSALVEAILPARVPGFEPAMLDALSATGQVVWVGCGSLGARDGRIAIYRRGNAGLLLAAAADYPAPTPGHAAALEHLARRGASFSFELAEAVRAVAPGTTTAELDALLWDLVWAGQITNDTFAPLGSLRSRAAPRRRARGRAEGTSGRWSLTAGLLHADVSDTERTLARARMLLERYAIVSREAVLAEELPGGFTPIYRALSAMEETGQVRRGYFVEGLSGAQFATVGAVDRLRAGAAEDGPRLLSPERPPSVLMVSAVDPANPYGSLLPWPAPAGEAKPRRVPGAWVALIEGRALLYLAANRRQLLTFPESIAAQPEPGAGLAAALARLPTIPRRGRAALLIERIDGRPVEESPHREQLRASGFRRDYRGWTFVGTEGPSRAMERPGA